MFVSTVRWSQPDGSNTYSDASSISVRICIYTVNTKAYQVSREAQTDCQYYYTLSARHNRQNMEVQPSMQLL